VFAERMRLLALLVIATLADRERRPDSGIATATLIDAGAAVMAAPAHPDPAKAPATDPAQAPAKEPAKE
jgi:hypothetical protein